jgi:hypothetical protein
MTTDYQIQPNTRRCAASGRELNPGETYFSVLLDEAGKFVRKDYSKEAWQGPPSGAFSFWQGKVPVRGKRRPTAATFRLDDDLLLDCFIRLEDATEPGRLSFRYVLGLLLLRRKRFKLEGLDEDAGRQVMTFRCLRTGARHLVVDPGLSDGELEVVQDDVFQALGWD